MKYVVRARTGGELTFQSFGQLYDAWLLGLVDAEDEVREAGGTKWRRAGSIRTLETARRTGATAWKGLWLFWVIFAVAGSTVALVLLQSTELSRVIAGLGVALVVASVTVTVTVRAHQRARKP